MYTQSATLIDTLPAADRNPYRSPNFVLSPAVLSKTPARKSTDKTDDVNQVSVRAEMRAISGDNVAAILEASAARFTFVLLCRLSSGGDPVSPTTDGEHICAAIPFRLYTYDKRCYGLPKCVCVFTSRLTLLLWLGPADYSHAAKPGPIVFLFFA